MRRRAALLCAAIALAAPISAQQQDPPLGLIADRVALEEDILVAEGGVEIVRGETRLTAQRIEYDRAADRLRILGPLTLTGPEGERLLASEAELSDDLRVGILRSARVVVEQQLQLAANEVVVIDDRYTQLTRTVASSCRVCARSPIPTWEIRAERVVQDEQERQIYFQDAQFRVVGIPIAYIPVLRVPSPDNTRALGFLRPRIAVSTQLGIGPQIPYFIPLGESADVTLTPYITGQTRTLGYRYRQAFPRGTIQFDGAVSDDTLRDGLRSYLFAEGQFTLPTGFALGFDVELATDDDYLAEYGVTGKDRLDSAITLSRATEDQFVSTGLTFYRSLRLDDDGETLPFVEGRNEFVRRLPTGPLGGIATVSTTIQAYARDAQRGFDTASDPDTLPDGRDALRLDTRLDYRRTSVLAGGVESSLIARVDAQRFDIVSDDAFPPSVSRIIPTVGTELRWPLMRRGALRTDVIEPVAQVLWTDPGIPDAPNEDSTRVSLDEGNLFALNRFPGRDAIETGFRANLGVTWTRFGPRGEAARLTVGRVLRGQDGGQFTDGSGLDGRESDWLASGRLALSDALTVSGRALIDDDGDVTLGEARSQITFGMANLNAAYVWLSEQTQLDGIRRPQTSELSLGASYTLSPALSGSASMRYDFEADRAAESGLRLVWQNECTLARFDATRTYVNAAALSPETRFGVSFELKGFGGTAPAGPQGVCGPNEG